MTRELIFKLICIGLLADAEKKRKRLAADYMRAWSEKKAAKEGRTRRRSPRAAGSVSSEQKRIESRRRLSEWNDAHPESEKERRKNYVARHPERLRATQSCYNSSENGKTTRAIWRKNNPEKTKMWQARYHASDRGKRMMATWRKVNADKLKARSSRFWKANPEKRRAMWRRQGLRRYSTPHGKLMVNARNRLRSVFALLGMKKPVSTLKLTGCNWSQLKTHIESQFKAGMSWENYGIHGWHVDHKKPIASFDLTDESQLRECFHFSNLQPLWAIENLKKGCIVEMVATQ